MNPCPGAGSDRLLSLFWDLSGPWIPGWCVVMGTRVQGIEGYRAVRAGIFKTRELLVRGELVVPGVGGLSIINAGRVHKTGKHAGDEECYAHQGEDGLSAGPGFLTGG